MSCMCCTWQQGWRLNLRNSETNVFRGRLSLHEHFIKSCQNACFIWWRVEYSMASHHLHQLWSQHILRSMGQCLTTLRLEQSYRRFAENLSISSRNVVFVYWIKFYLRVFLAVPCILSHSWVRKWVVYGNLQASTWTNAYPVQWTIFALPDFAQVIVILLEIRYFKSSKCCWSFRMQWHCHFDLRRDGVK